MLWLWNNGSVWVVFAGIAAEHLAELARLAGNRLGMQRSVLLRSRLFFTVLTKLCAITTFASVFYLDYRTYLGSKLVLDLLLWEDSRDDERCGKVKYMNVLFQVLGYLVSSLILSSSESVGIALLAYVGVELVTFPLVYLALPEESKHTMCSLLLTVPGHRAGIVSGSCAITGASLCCMSPVVAATYLFIYSLGQDEQIPMYSFGLLFGLVRLGQALGPHIGDSIHKATGSLLKTGLASFWLNALGIIPGTLVYVVHSINSAEWFPFLGQYLFIAFSSILWCTAFSTLQSVENRIVLEWSTNVVESESEQATLMASTWLVSSLCCVLLAIAMQDIFLVVAVSAIFAGLCSLVGAVIYTFWFIKNDQGPYRVVNTEGRVLLNISG